MCLSERSVFQGNLYVCEGDLYVCVCDLYACVRERAMREMVSTVCE